jgi:hypothetical protein
MQRFDPFIHRGGLGFGAFRAVLAFTTNALPALDGYLSASRLLLH